MDLKVGHMNHCREMDGEGLVGAVDMKSRASEKVESIKPFGGSLSAIAAPTSWNVCNQ